MITDLNLSVTLWPDDEFPHFLKFATDPRVAMVRLNSAMMNCAELDSAIERVEELRKSHDLSPLYFDVKGRQLRIAEVYPNKHYLDCRLNHPIEVDTPTVVLFKAGADHALLLEVSEDGYRLKFKGGPKYNVNVGESLHIRDESLVVKGDQFTELELQKISKTRAAGFQHYFLSYVECQRDVDEFRSMVGKDAIINLKIENKKGLEYVRREFKKKDNLNLVAARGDLFVELDRPHEILDAVRLIVDTDPNAIVGSRILLSVIHDPVPSCVDFSELGWLYDIGYRNMMLCDELCLKDELLSRAVNVFDAFRQAYGPNPRSWKAVNSTRTPHVSSDMAVLAGIKPTAKKSWWRSLTTK